MANTANLTANSTITTDFNVTPYYDDYDRYKNYFRILYKPGFAVQARELTQTQSMLQNQIFQFGSHVFKYGSKVLLGEQSLYANNRPERPVPYVKVDIDPNQANANTVVFANFLGKKVTGATSGIYGTITDILDADDANPKTIYISYGSAANTADANSIFQPSEVLVSNIGNLVVLGAETTPIGLGSKFEIGDGVFFAKDHFITFGKQSVIVDRYNPDPTKKIGFIIRETIVNASQDTSLLDPALEASNYAAPGADRFKLDPILTVLDYDDQSGPPEFVTLMTIKDGRVQVSYDRPQYNVLQKEMAKRTFDESGDYYVKGMSIQVREHDNNGSNFGKYANGNSDLLFVGVEPGTSYVRGYEINTLDTTELETPKSIEYSTVTDQTTTSVMGNFITVNEFVGSWELDVGKTINLYDLEQRRVTNRLWSVGGAPGSIGGPPTANLIGTALIQSIEYRSGVPGYDAKYDLYLSDISMIGTNSFSSVKSVYYNNPSTSDIGADVVLNLSTNTAVLQDAAGFPLLYYAGSDHTRKIRSANNQAATDMNYLFYKNFGISSPIAMTGTGQFSVSVSGEETFPYTSGTLSDIPDSNKKTDIIVTLNESFNIALPGTVKANAGSKILQRDIGTYFDRLNVGDKIQITGNAEVWYITSIDSAASMTVDRPLPSNLTGNNYVKVYHVGDIIDFSKKGVDSGTDRTISATQTTLTFNAQETALDGKTVTVVARVSRGGALEVPKTFNALRYVKINCGTHPSGTTGPYSLGFSDVAQVKKILKKTSSFPTSNVAGSDVVDVTRSFVFDNGQRDTHYDLATITPKIALSSDDRLLVELSYFSSDFTSRKGYYTIDSYLRDGSGISIENIPVYKSPTSGINYDLRNYIDFRPMKSIVVNDISCQTIANANTNPSASSTYTLSSGGLRLTVPSERITYDYSYYYGRIDVVCLNQYGQFIIVKGVPSANPLTPTNIPDDSMVLGIIEVPPYPSLSPAYAETLNKKSSAAKVKKVASVRHTMRDIGVLKNRIENLEYYAQLSLLEKAAADLLVTDENGLDRFKNGIFVDTFNNHDLGATQLPDYRIVVDEREKSIRPLYTTKVFGFDLQSNNEYTIVSNNMVTLSYTEEPMLSVNAVTTIRNIERTSYLYVGRLSLLPSEDIWINTEFAPDENLYVNGATISNDPNDPGSPTGSIRVIETTWEAWKKYVTGYNIYTGTDANKTLVSSASTKTEANNIAARYRNSTAVTIETVYNNQRVGTELFATEFADSAVSGYKIVDVSQIAYIRPQTIYASGRGLKPFSRLYTFFDNEDISSYVTPLNTTQYDALTDDNPDTIPTGVPAEGSALRVTANGDILFAMRLDDSKKFLTGTKSVVVTDSPTNTEADASTGAVAYFTAAGTKVLKQRTVYSTKNEIVYSRDVEQNYASSDFEVLARRRRRSCFDPNALVTMADGSKKRIVDIVVGDKVLSGNGKDVNTVVGMEEVPLEDRKMYKFNNTWAFVSEEHPILTNKGWAAFNPTSWAVEDEFVGKLALIDVGTEIAKYDGSYEKIEHIEAMDMDSEYLIYNLMLDGDHTYIVEDYVVHNKKSCLAYSFLAKAPDGEEGMFLSSVDIFIAEKDPDLGIWFEIREMDDAGGITRTQVPMSEIWFNSADVPISTDGITNPLTVRFKTPIFLFNNVQYAFVIHTENVSPNYYIWIARQGLTDPNTNQAYTDRPLTGTFFTTNNNLNWDIVPDIDLTCVFRRASFTTDTVGTVVLGNKSVEKIVFNSVSKPLQGAIGDVFTAGDKITITSPTGTFNVGDYVIGATSGANGKITSIISSSRFTTSNTGFAVSETINAYTSAMVNKNVSATVSSLSRAIATLSEYNESAKEISAVFIKSNGEFRPNDIIKSSRDATFTANVQSIQDFRYSVLSLEPSYLKFNSTEVEYAIQGYSNTGSADGSYVVITPEETYYQTSEKKLYSRSNEVANLSGRKTSNVRVNMSTSSSYVSPVLDLDKTSMIYVDNIINANTSGENLPSYGALNNKYISKTVTLAEGQDAEDIRVVLTSYRPPTTDVKVWIRILNGQDSDAFIQRGWIELERSTEGDATFSSLTNRNDFKEYTYSIPAANANTETGVVTYTNSSGVTFERYKYFAVKIGLVGNETNSAIVPRVADLRVIALQT